MLNLSPKCRRRTYRPRNHGELLDWQDYCWKDDLTCIPPHGFGRSRSCIHRCSGECTSKPPAMEADEVG